MALHLCHAGRQMETNLLDSLDTILRSILDVVPRMRSHSNSVMQEQNPVAFAISAPITTLSSSPHHPHAAAALAVSGAQPASTRTTPATPPSLPKSQQQDDKASPMHEAAAVSGSIPDTVSRGITLRGLRKLSADIHRLFQEGHFSRDLQTQVSAQPLTPGIDMA